MQITVARNGRIREWFDKDKKHHKEEIVDVFFEGKRLPRGFCYNVFKKVLIMKKNESVTLGIQSILDGSGVS